MKQILSSVTLLFGLFGDGTARTQEPGLAGKPEILFSCGFEDDDWWRAWGSTGPPGNTSLDRLFVDEIR